MRISELSTRSGVPVATIKFYLRDGLLPPGVPTGRNQADYGDEHLRRLHLIRVLADAGGLGLAAVRRVLAALDDETMPKHDVLGVAQYALGPEPPAGPPPPEVAAALREVSEWVSGLGWHVEPGSPSLRRLADALVALRSLGYPATPDAFAPYADAAGTLAAGEIAALPDDVTTSAIEVVVVGTVVFEAVFAALRRIAHEHHSALRFGKTGARARGPRARRTARAGSR